MIYQVNDLSNNVLTPTLPASNDYYIARSAEVIGDVNLSNYVSVWPMVVIRGDVNFVRVGAYSNIQDGSILHGGDNDATVLGKYVTVGHKAIIHGCTIGDYSLIGMGATILTGAKIGKGVIIAAGAVVKENAIIPDYTLFAGIPAQQKRILATDAESEASVLAAREHHALSYWKWAQTYINSLKEITL